MSKPSEAARQLGKLGGSRNSEAQRAARSQNIARANLKGRIEAVLGDAIVRCEVERAERRVWLVLNFHPRDSLRYLERLTEMMIDSNLLPKGWTVGLTKENA